MMDVGGLGGLEWEGGKCGGWEEEGWGAGRGEGGIR